MKKTLIGALVGGLILFIWQFLSWSALNLHGSNMQYTPSQDKILSALAEEGLEDGTYFMPNVKPGATAEEYEAYQKANIGKPWALISYHNSLNNNMGMNMVRGFLIDFLAVFFLCYLLLKNPKLDFQTTLVSTLMIGLIGYFTISYLNTIWFESSSIPELIDTIVQWGLTGAFLGWYLPEKD
ncbi:MAG: hypothetical protein HKN51_11830 [Saprospiraceae bacterium]|nr:hypothetical protein [Saprospiraceae bacterium]